MEFVKVLHRYTSPPLLLQFFGGCSDDFASSY
jgi:hypothetical protein